MFIYTVVTKTSDMEFLPFICETHDDGVYFIEQFVNHIKCNCTIISEDKKEHEDLIWYNIEYCEHNTPDKKEIVEIQLIKQQALNKEVIDYIVSNWNTFIENNKED